MSDLSITYTDKDQAAPIGTIERTWRAEDANEVKDVVNAISSIVLNIQAGAAMFYEVALTEETGVTVEHDFGRYPVINAVNDSGEQCHVGVIHTSTSSCTLTFQPSFTGVIQFT